MSILLSLKLCSQQQEVRPVLIGESAPDILFKNIVNPIQDVKSMAGLKGKLVILDFWSSWCKGCISSVPKMEALQEQFNGQLQIVLINPWETKEEIEVRYKQMKKVLKNGQLSTLPTVLGDSIWKSYFPHASVPHHIWINKTGKVIAITNGRNATAENVEKVLTNGTLKLHPKQDLKLQGLDVWKSGLFATKHISMQTPYLSGFVRYNSGYGGGSAVIKDTANKTYTRLWFNLPIKDFYNIAYGGGVNPLRLIVECSDTVPFFKPHNATLLDEWYNENLFSYQLTLPIAIKDSFRRYMKHELNSFLGIQKLVYAQPEERLLPAYVLKVFRQGLLKSNGNERKYVITNEDKTIFVNQPFLSVSSFLRTKIEDMQMPLVFIDETGFTGNADIELRGDFINMEALNRQLAHYGLKLEKTTRKVEVLCIKDVK